MKQFIASAWTRSKCLTSKLSEILKHNNASGWATFLVSLVMVYALLQTNRAIKQTAESIELQRSANSNAAVQLRIEQDTRLYPELECRWDTISGLVLRNVGTAPATNINLRTAVVCVTSNVSYDFRARRGHIFNFHKGIFRPANPQSVCDN
jgi:hypothetical protein